MNRWRAIGRVAEVEEEASGSEGGCSLMKASHKQLRHAIAGVAKFDESKGLLPGAPECDRQIVASVRAALGHLAYFKTLRSQLVEFAIYISLSSAK